MALWVPEFEGDFPTLGNYVIDWITENLAQPAIGYYAPFVPYAEQEDFIRRWYEVDPATGRRLRYQRGLLGRARGWGKSPLLAAICAVEALADVYPDGFDADGQPVGRPWSDVRTPLVQVAAVTEEQTRNTWQPLLEMLRGGPVMDNYGVDALDTFVALQRGKIEMITASPRSAKGAPATFAVMDQTEEWTPAVNGPRLAQTIRSNVAKNDGRTLESPNAYIPGTGSVAEASAKFAEAIAEGKLPDEGLLHDHRPAPDDTDLASMRSVEYGLRVAYGDSSGHPDGCVIHEPPCAPGHVKLEPLLAMLRDPSTDVQLYRSDFLNQVTHASNSFLDQPSWNARIAGEDVPAPARGEWITLGFDGSRGRARGKPDATALVACRVSDGYLWPLEVWEADDGPGMEDWEPPVAEVEAQVRDAFATYRVAAFYADPARDWRSHVNKWEALYGARVVKKVKADHPFEWWGTGGRSLINQRAIEAFEAAVRNGEMTHSGSAALTRHVLNARRGLARGYLRLVKQDDYSSHKIDAAVAAVYAWQARLDAVAAGVLRRTSGAAVRRVR